MGFNDYNIGQEGKLDLVNTLTGQVVNTYGLTKWTTRQVTGKETSKPINKGGKCNHRTIFNGWEGELVVDRYTNDLDMLAETLEQNYYNGGGEIYFRLIVTARNPQTRAIEQWMYNQVSIHLDDGGDWESEKKVTQKLKYNATDRIRLV